MQILLYYVHVDLYFWIPQLSLSVLLGSSRQALTAQLFEDFSCPSHDLSSLVLPFVSFSYEVSQKPHLMGVARLVGRHWWGERAVKEEERDVGRRQHNRGVYPGN
jgi:hypothetical protein